MKIKQMITFSQQDILELIKNKVKEIQEKEKISGEFTLSLEVSKKENYSCPTPPDYNITAVAIRNELINK